MSGYCSECQRPLDNYGGICWNHPEAPVDETPGPPEEPEESPYVYAMPFPADFGMNLQAPTDASEESVRYAGNPDANPLSMPPPSTERALTSEDFLPTSSEAAGRSEFFKAMAFEADKRVKELEQKQATLEVQCAAATKSVTVIQKRIKVWVEQHWATPTDETMQMMLGLLAETKRVL